MAVSSWVGLPPLPALIPVGFILFFRFLLFRSLSCFRHQTIGYLSQSLPTFDLLQKTVSFVVHFVCTPRQRGWGLMVAR